MAAEEIGQGGKVFQDGVDGVVTGHAFGFVEETAGERAGLVHGDPGALQGAEGGSGVAEVAAEHAAGFGEKAAERAAGGRIGGRGRRRHKFGGAGQEADERVELRAAAVGRLLFDEIQDDAGASANSGFGQVEALAEGFDDLIHAGPFVADEPAVSSGKGQNTLQRVGKLFT